MIRLRHILWMSYILFVCDSMVFADSQESTKTKQQLLKYTIDPIKSELQWNASYTQQKDPTPRRGSAKIQSGKILSENGTLSSANIIIDMNTVTFADSQNPSFNRKLMNQLFAIKTYPTAKIHITKFQPLNPKTYQAKSQITIRDIRKSVNFSSSLSIENSVLKGFFSIVVNAKDIFPEIQRSNHVRRDRIEIVLRIHAFS